MASDIWIFLSQLWRHSVAVLFGGLISLLFLLRENYYKKPLKWRQVVIIMITALLISCFFAWREEHASAEWRGNEISKLTGQLRVLSDANTPRLVGELKGFSTSDSVLSDKRKQLLKTNELAVLVIASIKNLGAPSIAEHWSLTIQTAGGKRSSGAIRFVPPTFTVRKDSQSMGFSGEDALYNKGIAAPIPKGGEISGVLFFSIENLTEEQIHQPGTLVTLTVRDVLGIETHMSMTLTGKRLKNFEYFPGLKLPSEPKR